MSSTAQPDYEYTLTLPATPDRVFRALLEPEALRTWFAAEVEVDPRVGGPYRFWGRNTLGTRTPDDATQRIEALEPNARLAFTWAWAGVPTQVEIALAPAEWKEWTLGSQPPTRPPQPGCAVTVRQRFAGTLPFPRPENLVDDHWRLVLANLLGYLDDDVVVLPDYDDPAPEVRLSLHIAAPPSHVFRALTEPALLNRWFASDAKVDLREGGAFDLGWGGVSEHSADAVAQMRVLELVPDKRLALSWPDWRSTPGVPDQKVSWDLVPEAGGTRVEFRHTGFTRTVDRSDYQQGWSGFFQALDRVACGVAG